MKKSGRRGSNSGLLAPHASTLPTALRPVFYKPYNLPLLFLLASLFLFSFRFFNLFKIFSHQKHSSSICMHLNFLTILKVLLHSFHFLPLIKKNPSRLPKTSSLFYTFINFLLSPRAAPISIKTVANFESPTMTHSVPTIFLNLQNS